MHSWLQLPCCYAVSASHLKCKNQTSAVLWSPRSACSFLSAVSRTSIAYSSALGSYPASSGTCFQTVWLCRTCEDCSRPLGLDWGSVIASCAPSPVSLALLPFRTRLLSTWTDPKLRLSLLSRSETVGSQNLQPCLLERLVFVGVGDVIFRGLPLTLVLSPPPKLRLIEMLSSWKPFSNVLLALDFVSDHFYRFA